MQADRTRDVIRMLVERILSEVLPDETGAARLQQVGLFTLIYMLQSDPEPVTAARLARIVGLADAQVIRPLRKLMQVGLVERTQILNRQGRGRAYQLSIKYNAKARRLLKAMDKGRGGKKR